MIASPPVESAETDADHEGPRGAEEDTAEDVTRIVHTQVDARNADHEDEHGCEQHTGNALAHE
jgi:hypothetical protein